MTTDATAFRHAQRALKLIVRLHRWAAASVQVNRLGRDLSLRQLSVLFAIREGLSSPGQIARQLRATPAVITGLLDRLERRGYVRREAEPEDRRRLRLVLTETGLAVGQEVHTALAGALADQLTGISPAALGELGRALDVLESALATLEARTPAPMDAAADEDDGT